MDADLTRVLEKLSSADQLPIVRAIRSDAARQWERDLEIAAARDLLDAGVDRAAITQRLMDRFGMSRATAHRRLSAVSKRGRFEILSRYRAR